MLLSNSSWMPDNVFHGDTNFNDVKAKPLVGHVQVLLVQLFHSCVKVGSSYEQQS
jgi:hypothetical protein